MTVRTYYNYRLCLHLLAKYISKVGLLANYNFSKTYIIISIARLMNIQLGPRKLEKLIPGCKVMDFEVNNIEPLLLIASSQNKLQSVYLKYSSHPGLSTKLLPIKTVQTDWVPQLFSYSGKQNIVYCSQQNLIINNKRQIKNKSKITNLLVDDQQVALTTALDTIHITSISKGQPLGQLHYYGQPLSSLFWHNTLAISGDEGGTINLWDINKQKILHTNSVFASQIDHISSYVDFIHTNLYYSMSKSQRRMAFHDLRTHQPIRIINQLPNDIAEIHHNASGKIFMMTPQHIEMIDVYQGYDVMGRFAPVRGQNIDDFLLKHPEGQTQDRSLTSLLVEGKHLIAGCSNGCIEVYNSDTLECVYGYGVCESSGIKKLRKLGTAILALQTRGIISMIQFG